MEWKKINFFIIGKGITVYLLQKSKRGYYENLDIKYVTDKLF